MSEQHRFVDPAEPRIRKRTRMGNMPAEADRPRDPAPSDYEVGYGRPPVARQFRKGQSGNPRGRPKKSETLSALAKEALDQKHVVKFGDKPTKKSIREIGVLHDAKKAAAGDHKAFERLRNMAGETNDVPAAAGEGVAQSELCPADVEVLRAHYVSILLEVGLSEDNAIAALAKFGFGTFSAGPDQGEGGHA